MKKLHTLAAAVMALGLASPSAMANKTFTLYDHVSFYDGYLVDNIPADAPDQGVTRLYTFLNTVKISDEVLDQLGSQLSLDVTIHAVCDNYDRIGNVNLALVPKGETYTVKYDETDPARIEIARFITPFMDKNKKPDSVPYHYDMDYISSILRDKSLREKYDFWIEFEVFGVPYVANEQISGCAGCNEVFQGTMTFTTDDIPAGPVETNVLVPITIRTGDYRNDHGLNNYNEACTDEIGRCIKTWSFDVPEDLTDARLVLIMSNHGANAGGEEYIRRRHFVSLDDERIANFKPGGVSCEPFRKYNTQLNGIYGTSVRDDNSWILSSNWCPGSAITTRLFELEALGKGTHTVTIEVPQATFKDKQGYFPTSIFLQGATDGKLAPEGAIESIEAELTSQVQVLQGSIVVTSDVPVKLIQLFNVDGTMAAYRFGNTIPTNEIRSGVYLLGVTLENGMREMHKLAI